MKKYWEIEEGKVDSTRFFQLLLRYFPDGTTFYAEGTSIESDVVQLYKTHYQEGEYLPKAGTRWPKADKYRCQFSRKFINALAQLSENHAEPELLDHLALYKDNEPLLMWHDAFYNAIKISVSIPDEVVSAFAGDLGLGYREVSE